MSTIVQNRDARGRFARLAPRAVRVRNFYVRAIARKRGLREPGDAELARLQADVTLSAAVGWWEQVQREEGLLPQEYDEAVGVDWQDVMIKVAVIAAFVMFTLVAFPGEIAGSGAGARIWPLLFIR